MRKLILVGTIIGLAASMMMPVDAEARRGFRSRSSRSIIPRSAPKSSKPAKTTAPVSPTTPTAPVAPTAASMATPSTGGGMMSGMMNSFMGTSAAMWLFGNNRPAQAAPNPAETPKVEALVQENVEPAVKVKDAVTIGYESRVSE